MTARTRITPPASLLAALISTAALVACDSSSSPVAADTTDIVDTTPADTTPTGDTADADAPDDTAAPPPEPRPELVDPVIVAPAAGDEPVAVQPSVAISAVGAVGVAWTGRIGEESGIFYAQYRGDKGLTPSRPPARINADVRGLQNEPVVCARSDGQGWVVAWSVDTQEVGPDGENLEVRFRQLDPSGAPLTTDDHRILTARPGNHWLVDLDCGSARGFAVAGVRPADPGAGFEAFVQRYHFDGTPDGPAIALAPGAASQIFPVLSSAWDGSIVALWEEQAVLDGPNATVGVVVGVDGTPGPLLTIAAPPDGSAAGAFVAADPAGGSFLAGSVVGQRFVMQHMSGGVATNLALAEPGSVALTTGDFAAAGGDRYGVVYFRGGGAAVDARVAWVDGGALSGDAVTVATGRLYPQYQPSIAVRAGLLAVAFTEGIGGGKFRVHLAAYGTR